MYEVAKVLGYILLGVAVIVAVVCSASVKATTITISDTAVMAPYPANVAEMSQEEFYDWAVARNAKARTGWWAAYEAAGPKFLYGTEKITRTRSGSLTTGSSFVSPFGVAMGAGEHSFKSTISQKSKTWQRPNPDFRHPGPLTIINPYVKPRR